MLQIKTTNGNTLVHADQQPDTYNGRSYDGSQYMVHAGEWGRHKYIRKEGNRYIYPEDLQKKASAGLHKVAKAAKDVYDDREIYAKAAKKMVSDAAERSKYRMKDELRKQHEERKAKEARVKERNAKMAEGVKKVAKVLMPRQVGTIINVANDLANSGKKEEVATKSMPKKSKRPISREKKVVDGGKEIKKGEKANISDSKGKRPDGVAGVGGRLRITDDPGDYNYYNHEVDGKKAVKKLVYDKKDRAKKEESQIRSAHQGDVYGQHKTTENLELQKKKTASRKVRKEKRR